MVGVEQRKHPRVPIERDVVVMRDGHELAGGLTNLSLGGACIGLRLEPPGALGERISVMFSIPGLGTPLRVEAQIRWQGPDDTFGVQFVSGFRAHETYALGRFLERENSGSRAPR